MNLISPNPLRPLWYGNLVNRSCQLNKGLAAWWKILPAYYGGHQWIDLLGLNPGTLTNMGAGSGWGGSPAPGGLGPSMRFDGVDDSVDLAKPVYLLAGGGLTILASINLTSIPSSFANIVSTYTSYPSQVQYTFRIHNTGALACYLRTNADFEASGPTLTAKKWCSVAVVLDDVAKTITLYLNAIPSTPLSYTGAPAITTAVMQIGNSVGASQPLNGLIDSVKIYSRALAPSDVAWEYRDALAGCPDTLSRRPEFDFAPAAVQPVTGSNQQPAVVTYRQLPGNQVVTYRQDR